MKKFTALIVLLACLSACAPFRPASSPETYPSPVEKDPEKPTPEVADESGYYFTPIAFESREKFEDFIRRFRKGEIDEEYLPQHQQAIDQKMDEIQYYFFPPLIEELYDIWYVAADGYAVAIYYYDGDVNAELGKNVSRKEYYENFNSKSVTFEWVRNTEGGRLYEGYSEQFSLEKEKSCEIYRTMDVHDPYDRYRVVGKQIFWVQDGYTMDMYLPLALYEKYADDLTQILYGEAVKIE